MLWHGSKHKIKWISALILISICFLTGCYSSKEISPKWYGMDLAGGLSKESINSWTLASTHPDHAPLGIKAFQGKAVLVFFGYTQCPDVCPTTLSKLARLR